MTKPLRWGVLSTANIGRIAVNPAIRASSNGELVAVASRDADRARTFAQNGGFARWHDSYEALIEDDTIDAIYNPLPNGLHGEWTIRALRAGRHVLCEKPLALDEAECHEMDAAAREHGVKLMEAFMYRFHPRVDRLLELVRSGTIGEPRMVRSAFTFRLTRPDNIRMIPELGGGALMDVGCYCVNVSRTVLGEEPVEVQAIARWSTTGVDEQLAGLMRFPSGAMAQFDCALTLERREICEVAGTEGHLHVPSAFLPGTGEVPILEQHGRSDEVRHTVAGTDQYVHMVEHFADCALNGGELRYPVADAAANMRVIDALYRSARAGGRPERIARSAAR